MAEYGDENENTLNTHHSNIKDVAQKVKPVGPLSQRLTRLAQKTSKKLVPSTAELERMYVEAKRQELQELRRKNERSCYEAINNPQDHNSSRSITPCRSVCSENSSEGYEDSSRCSSLNRQQTRSKFGPGTPWKPQLTVPKAPTLHTSWRPRSYSRGRDRQGSDDQVPHPGAWSRGLRGSYSRSASVGSSRQGSRRTSHQGSAAPSPARSTSSVRSTRSVRSQAPALTFEKPGFDLSTPLRKVAQGLSKDLMTPSPARSVRSCASLRSCSESLASLQSRLSKLSRCSGSRCRAFSTDELERIRAEEGKRRLSELMKHNAKAYKQAINCPDMRIGHHSLELTVPHEFNLSVTNRSTSSSKGPHEDRRKADWSNTLRRESRESQSPARDAWQPQLTAPRAPILQTANRQRSSSSSRSNSVRRSVSAKQLPARERVAVQRHLQRTASAREAACKATEQVHPKALKLSPEDELWIQAASTAEERAERARTAMKSLRQKARAEETERLWVFRRPAPAQTHGRPAA